jgi:hypothetical protein
MEDSFRKSSYSANGGSDCVEIGQATEVIGVRDTTDRDGGTLRFTAEAWQTFLGTIR